jgi:acid stress-induced BolA-like protein IbaG/YrbA
MREMIIKLIEDQIDTELLEVEVSGNHCTITAVSNVFDGLNAVKRQQKIYQCLNAQIASGEIHAVNIKALTPAQWQQSR